MNNNPFSTGKCRTWRTEFGDDWAVPQEVLDAVTLGGLTDISWHNDACPSFRVTVTPEDIESGAFLWVEHPYAPECSDKRFTVVNANQLVCETDDISEAMGAIVGIIG